ncbi:hypothetical protein LTR08_005943 [Meristemomyces frigidus]|nr:hypothetical protein LTR08_005943 [Meristemomyces frigidus]
MPPSTEEEHGWTAVPRSFSKLLASIPDQKPSLPMQVEDIPLPTSELVHQVTKYAKQNLPEEVFNHSMRVYYYGKDSPPNPNPPNDTNTAPPPQGQAITKQHFPTWHYTPSTLLLAALLHDIGTTPTNQSSTRLSFEFSGAILSLALLKSLQADISQAELVCETIIRHQDLGDTGNVTTLTAVILFATVFDNVGLHPELVHQQTIESVVAAFPRNGWTGCFAHVVRKECELKPWANTTRIEGFAELVEGNTLMERYD